MRTALATFLILSFVGIAVFGFMAMSNHVHGCIAETASGSSMPCPAHQAEAFLDFHINAFRAFSLATFEKVLDGFASLFILLLAFAVALLAASLASLAQWVLLRRINVLILRTRTYLYWLSLFELSPSSFSVPR